MTVKRFVAPDMRRALDLVRQEIGPDAIILSSQRTKEGVEIITSTELDYATRGVQERRDFGQRFDEESDIPFESDQAWKSHAGLADAARKYAPQEAPPNQRAEQLAMEIEAARERMMAAKRGESASQTASEPQLRAGPEKAEQLRRKVAERDRQSADLASARANSSVDRQMAGLQEQVQRLTAEQTRQAANEDDQRLADLKSEIADMRMLLEQQMWRMRDGERQSAQAAQPTSASAELLQNHLAALGLPNKWVKKLALSAKPGKRLNTAWRESLAVFSKQIPTDRSDRINSGGLFAFVGPTGVGKTTTIAKLAARYVLEHGLGKVALITTDTYRVGAHDQLRSLGRILNVPVRVVDNERSLPSVVASLKAFPLILIDTAGFRQGDPLLKEQEAQLSACPGIERVLVLSCNSQMQTLKASAHAFSGGAVSGCVLTKLDETGSLGEALSVIIDQQLPVLYSTDGQAIPNDIHVASASGLVSKAVALMKAHQESERLTTVAR